MDLEKLSTELSHIGNIDGWDKMVKRVALTARRQGNRSGMGDKRTHKNYRQRNHQVKKGEGRDGR